MNRNLTLEAMALQGLIEAHSAEDPEKAATFRGMSDMLFAAAEGKSMESAIHAQEARGQDTLVRSDLLPVDAPWAKLEALGFVRLDEGDGVLCRATLPPGWEKRGGEDSRESYIYDEDGHKRAGIFYKAAFYDRKADLWLIEDE